MPTFLRSICSALPFVFIGYFFVGAGACGGDDPKQTCVSLPVNCTPGIDPTFTQIYAQIVTKRCGGGESGNQCHGPQGLQGGLGLFDADTAYDDLLGRNGRARVLPENPECSILMERLTSDDPKFRMPYQGTKLEPGLLCAVQQWIENGAAK